MIKANCGALVSVKPGGSALPGPEEKSLRVGVWTGLVCGCQRERLARTNQRAALFCPSFPDLVRKWARAERTRSLLIGEPPPVMDSSAGSAPSALLTLMSKFFPPLSCLEVLTDQGNKFQLQSLICVRRVCFFFLSLSSPPALVLPGASVEADLAAAGGGGGVGSKEVHP